LLYDATPQLLTDVQILLIEDEFDVANLLLFILVEAGVEVVLGMRSADAITSLRHFHPDVLLCNIKLPDHNGTG
jgi:DNA-binding response OmpR family regulator